MKKEKLYELIELAQQLRQAYPDGHPVFNNLDEAIREGVADVVREVKGSLTWDEIVQELNTQWKTKFVRPGDVHIPGNLYVDGKVTFNCK